MRQLLLLITFSFVFALITEAQQHSLIQYSVSEGLAQSEVNKIHQDQLGYLWLATAGGGVSKFDGVNFKNYNENNGLGGNIITDITEGNNNCIYFASTWGPVSCYKNDKIVRLSDKETAIKYLLFDKNTGILFAAKNNKLLYLSNNNWSTATTNTDAIINGLLSNASDQVYYFTDYEIFSLDTKSKLSKVVYKAEDKITSVYSDTEDHLIIATLNNKIIDYSTTKTSLISFNKPFPENSYITKIIKDLTNTFWFSTQENGIFMAKDGALTSITQSNGLPSNTISYLFCDKQNNIWLSVTGEGIFKHLKSPFVSYSNVEGLNKPNNFAVLKDSKGNIWSGTNKNGCYVYDGEQVTNYKIGNKLPSNSISSIIETADKTIWIGTKAGIVSYKNNKFTTINATNGLVGDGVNYLYADKQQRLWVATNSGLSILKDGVITNYTTKNGLSDNKIHTVFEDHKGIIWLGTSDGLLKYYQGNFRKYGMIDGLCNSYVGSIIEDDNGILWVGTDRCISKLVNEKFIPYTEKDGLNSTIIYLMNKDNAGNLWIGTNKGLDKITLDKNSDITKIEFFGKNEGFYGIENNTRGTCKDAEGNLYFATIKGIFKYRENNNLQQAQNFPLYITSVKLFLNPIDSTYQHGEKNAFGITDSLTLPAKKNHLTFEFTGIDLVSSTDVIYSYKLENFDSTWFENTSAKYAVYSNLPPGKYTFKVKAWSKKNKSTPEFAFCHVTIQELLPPFYTTWWFLILSTLLLISLVYNLVFLRNKALRISKEELEDKIKERTLEISKQNKEKTVLLQEIHHRVKNNLQIINSLFNIQAHYTSNEETKTLFKESQNRILSMSKIHQTLYESNDFSRLNVKTYLITLVNDIKESYLVDEKVAIQLDIDDNITIDLDSLIPFALIINEIISNAFKYAFKNRENNLFSIKIKQTKEKKTTIEFKDNGVGLPKTFNWDNPSSMGIDLIKTLTEQLEGTIEVKSNEQGISYLLIFVSK